jgi:hypothetical protein
VRTQNSTFRIKDAIVVGESAKAIDCRWGDGRVAHWIARSQLQPGTTVRHEGDRGTVVIPRWLAERARIIQPEAQVNG